MWGGVSLRARVALTMSTVMLGPLLAAMLLLAVPVLAGSGAAGGPRPLAVVLAALLVVATMALVVLLAVRLSRPLAAVEHLAQAAAAVADGDLQARSGVGGEDEVGRLGVALDAVALRLQRTQGELGRRERALAAAYEQFGEALASTHDLDGLLRTVVDAACRAASAQVGTVLLGDASELTERVSSVPDGAGGVWVSEVLERLSTLGGRSARTGRCATGDLDPVAGPALAAPLRRGPSVIGVLAVAVRRGGAVPDEAAVAAVEALAAQAGTAVANVREHLDARRLSVTDALTGAGNVRHLTSSLNREVERAHRFGRTLSVLMLDLDHFKQVNDVAGHDFGDAVLREFAARLHGCVREVDLVARRGGEEFTVVLPETGSAGAQAVARRILDRVRSQPFRYSGLSRSVTTSIGVASYPEHADSAAAVMHAADVALYEAKRTGRDRWCLAPPRGGAEDPRARYPVVPRSRTGSPASGDAPG